MQHAWYMYLWIILYNQSWDIPCSHAGHSASMPFTRVTVKKHKYQTERGCLSSTIDRTWNYDVECLWGSIQTGFCAVSSFMYVLNVFLFCSLANFVIGYLSFVCFVNVDDDDFVVLFFFLINTYVRTCFLQSEGSPGSVGESVGEDWHGFSLLGG